MSVAVAKRKVALEITGALEGVNIKTVTGKETWCPGVIEKMLVNEKYMGDALLQKTYTVDFLTKKRVKNNGIVPQYYIEEIMRPLFQRNYFIKYRKRGRGVLVLINQQLQEKQTS